MSTTFAAHTTEHEIEFLNGIVSNKNTIKNPRSVEAKINALKGYISAAENRTDWIGMDKVAILEHAKKLLVKI